MKTTEENNEMIAEFMGAIKYRPDADYIEMLGNLYEIEDAEYHTSWDWLMPVASKLYLESVGIEPFRISHIFHNFDVAVRNNEIMVAHKYICDGINILNEQNS